jgi:hypothetical protein
MHQYSSKGRKKYTNMRMVEGAGGAWRRKLASGAGLTLVAALVEGA